MTHDVSVNGYLEAVRDQIRWKKAREAATVELEAHICDQRDAYIAEGMAEDEATRRAIAEMGDPVATGQQLDRVHRPRPDGAMLAIVAAVLALGVGLQYVLSANGYQSRNTWFVPYWHMLPLGIAALVAAFILDYSIIGKRPIALYLGGLVAVVAASRIFPYGRGYGASYMLLLIPLYAGVVYSQRGMGYRAPIVCASTFLLTARAMLTYPSFAVFMQFTIACVILLAIAIRRGWFRIRTPIAYAILFAPVVLIPLLAIRYEPYRFVRLFAFLHPAPETSLDFPYQLIRGLLANAKPWGAAQLPVIPEGITPDLSLEQYLMAWRTDYMLIYVVAKFGAVPAALLVGASLALPARLFAIARKQRSELGRIVILSVALIFALQILLFVLMNLGVIAGMSGALLPLLSYDGMGLAVNLFLLGLAFSAARRNAIVRDASVGEARRRGIGALQRMWARGGAGEVEMQGIDRPV